MKSETVTFQVKFWALIGPFVCLLSLFVLIAKGSMATAVMPLIFLIGVLFGWRWALKGLTFSVAALALYIFYSYSQHPLEERFWHLGMGCAMALSLVITTLSFKEVEAIVKGLKIESRSRLENLWKVDEKFQQSLEELKKKKERIRELNIKLRSYQKLVDRSVEEIIEFRTKQSECNYELQHLKSEKEKLQSLLEASNKRHPPSEQYQELQNKLKKKHQLLAETEESLLHANQKIMSLENTLQEIKISELSAVDKALDRQLQKMETEQLEQEKTHEQEVAILQAMLDDYIKEGIAVAKTDSETIKNA